MDEKINIVITEIVNQLPYIAISSAKIIALYNLGIHFSLNRQLSHKNIKINKLPQNIEDINQIREIQNQTLKFNNDIKYFKKTIKSNIPHASLSLFNNNLSTLLIEKVKPFLTRKNWIISKYSHFNNKISISRNSDIMHELLHVSSTINNSECIFSGFSQINKGKSIGDGLNEGYTSLLESRYFSEFHDHDAYVFEKRIAKIIEKIIGQKKMEQLYFNADLYGLFNELKQYGSDEEIFRFFVNLDFAHKYWYSNKTIIKRKFRNQAINETVELLIKFYINKISSLNNVEPVDKCMGYSYLKSNLSELRKILDNEKVDLIQKGILDELDIPVNLKVKKL